MVMNNNCANQTYTVNVQHNLRKQMLYKSPLRLMCRISFYVAIYECNNCQTNNEFSLMHFM